MKRLRLIALTLSLAISATSPAMAQQGVEDWDLTADPTQQLTLATLDFGGNALAFRCKAGVLDFLMTGAPATATTARIVQVTAGGIEDERQTWQTEPGLPVLSASEPDRLARLLRAGGDLGLRVEPVTADDRPLRYRLPIPPSATALDQVLSACGASLADEWDLRPRGLANGVVWDRLIAPKYPEAAATRDVPLATVQLACIVATEGRLDECRILSETPDGLGFGRSALAAARQSRVTVTDASSVGTVVRYSYLFRAPEG